MIVNQLLPAVHDGDAIGDEARSIKQWLTAEGHQSQIFCIQADPAVSGEVVSWKRFADYDQTGAVTILHYALPSPLNGLLMGCKGKKVIIYHNITPAQYLVGYGRELVRIALEGRRQLALLRECCELALADSEYNEMELQELGYKRTGVLPICYEFSRLDLPRHPVLARMFDDDFTNFIFVGRVAPNKRHEDVIKAYTWYKRYVRERCRLFLVGKFAGFFNYYCQLQGLLETLKAGDVYFTGHVTLQEMTTYYRLAHVFLSMSEHEGFCVPLLEAMHLRVPIVAYDAGAIAGTLRGAGVLLRSKNPLVTAEVCAAIYENQSFRQKLIAKQQQVKSYYEPATLKAKFLEYLEAI